MLSVRVKEPTVVAFILTVDPVFDPEIEPFPVIDQRWFTLSDGVGVLVKVFPVDPPYTDTLPVMVQEGVGLTFKVRLRVSLVTLQSAPDE